MTRQGADPSEFSRQHRGGQRQPRGGRQPPQQQPPQQHPPQGMQGGPPQQQPPQQHPPQGMQGGPPQQQPPQQQPPQGMGQPQGTGQQSPQGMQGGPPQQQPPQQQPPQGTGQQPPQGTSQQGMQQPSQGMGQPQGMQGAVPSQRGPSQARVPARAGPPRLRPITVEEVARSDVVTVESDATVAEIVSKMADQDVGSVVVVEDGRPTGIVTDRKIALALGEQSDVTDVTADEFATPDLATGTTDMSVYDAVRQFREAGIRRLPLVDEEGSLAGIVSLDDVIVLLAGELGVAAEVIEMQAPER